jgi:hypothetical protein
MYKVHLFQYKPQCNTVFNVNHGNQGSPITFLMIKLSYSPTCFSLNWPSPGASSTKGNHTIHNLHKIIELFKLNLIVNRNNIVNVYLLLGNDSLKNSRRSKHTEQ